MQANYLRANQRAQYRDMAAAGEFYMAYRSRLVGANRVFNQMGARAMARAKTRKQILSQARVRYCLDCLQVCLIMRSIPFIVALQFMLLAAFADGYLGEYTAHAVLLPAYLLWGLSAAGFLVGYMARCLGSVDSMWQAQREAEMSTSFCGAIGAAAASNANDDMSTGSPTQRVRWCCMGLCYAACCRPLACTGYLCCCCCCCACFPQHDGWWHAVDCCGRTWCCCLPEKTATKMCCSKMTCDRDDGTAGRPAVRCMVIAPFVFALVQVILVGVAMDFGEYVPWTIALIPFWIWTFVQLCMVPCVLFTVAEPDEAIPMTLGMNCVSIRRACAPCSPSLAFVVQLVCAPFCACCLRVPSALRVYCAPLITPSLLSRS